MLTLTPQQQNEQDRLRDLMEAELIGMAQSDPKRFCAAAGIHFEDHQDSYITPSDMVIDRRDEYVDRFAKITERWVNLS